MKRLLEMSIVSSLMFLTGCAGMMPDIVQMVSEIEDTAVKVEVNRDAIAQDTDIHVIVDVIQKDPPKAKL